MCACTIIGAMLRGFPNKTMHLCTIASWITESTRKTYLQTFQLAWWGTHLEVCLLITPPLLGEPPVSCRTCTDGLPV